MRLWRKLLIVAVAVLIVLAVVWGYLPKPVPVEVDQVSRGLLRETVEEEGKTRVTDRFVLSAPVPGFARRIVLDVGEPVEKGQALAQIEPQRSVVLDPRSRAAARAHLAAADAALSRAGRELDAARANHDLALTQLERARRLLAMDSISQEAFDQAETEARLREAMLRSAEFAVEVARHEKEAARTALRYSAAEGNATTDGTVVIRSPAAASVLKVFHESEGAVLAGEPLLEVGDPRSLEVEVDVLSADAVRMGPGTPVVLERWGGDEPLQGRVRLVEPVGFTKVSALGIEEQRVLVIVDITSPREQWERLGDGYRVEATFVTWEGPDVLQAPASALFREGDGWAVFVVESGRAVKRTVGIGHRGGLAVEVLSGLAEDELVITHPDDSIATGTRVEQRH
jgi:HlyD family secretion protein